MEQGSSLGKTSLDQKSNASVHLITVNCRNDRQDTVDREVQFLLMNIFRCQTAAKKYPKKQYLLLVQ
jgi:hypothetical protein